MTGQEREELIKDILGQIKYDSLRIEDLTPVVSLDDHDKIELHGGRSVELFRLVSAIRTDATLDRYRHVDRGEWVFGEMYYAGELNPATGMIETSHVWYLGCKYRCLVSGTNEPPLWSSIDWEFEEGYPFLKLEFSEIDSVVDIESPSLCLSVNASLYNQDVTHEPAIYYDWTRQSVRNGAPDTASDTLWNDSHKNAGSSLVLDASDLNFQFGAAPEKLTITVTATLHDPNNPNLQPEAAQYFMI